MGRRPSYDQYARTTENLLRLLLRSTLSQGLIIEGPVGWGKTTLIESAITRTGIQATHLPTGCDENQLFDFFAKNSRSVIIIDNSEHLFTNKCAMTMLKAAITPSGCGCRNIPSAHLEHRDDPNEVHFLGKLVLITEHLPLNSIGHAIRTRSFCQKIEFSASHARSFLFQAANESGRFTNKELAVDVASFLAQYLSDEAISFVNYRTLADGYALALKAPDSWQSDLDKRLRPEDESALTNSLFTRLNLP